MFEFVRRSALVCVWWALVSIATPAWADPVLDWSSTVDTATAKLPGARGDRARAIAWLAAFNALNAIDPRYRVYEPAPAAVAPGGAAPAPTAALAAALYTALAVEPEADQALLLRNYRDTLAALKAAPERDAGVALGSRAATLLLAARSGDRLGRVESVLKEPGPGVYVKPGYAKVGASVTLAALAPFGVRSVLAFDPGPPPAINSETAARETAEVRALGAAQSTVRSADQTAAALFWNSGDPSDYSAVVAPVLEARKLDALDTARVLALDAMISVDSNIVQVALKERYQHWRPETAIAGPFAAPADHEADWQSLVRAPNSPQYPSGGGVGAGTLEVVLPRLMGTTGALEWRNSQTNQTRRWPNAAALATEIAAARVWAGVHFRSAVDAGGRWGAKWPPRFSTGSCCRAEGRTTRRP
jgi:PAP2 superfamily